MHRIFILSALAVGVTTTATATASDRWYTQSHRDRGEVVYTANCQTCHAADGAGTANWKDRDQDGNLPPPPLNGSAHTWHHGPEVLVRTVMEGGRALGGTMPGFRERLNGEDTVALLAYITSLWPDDTYRKWVQRYPEISQVDRIISEQEERSGDGSAESPVTSAGSGAVTARLSRRMPESVEMGEPRSTPVNGVVGVRVANRYVYLDRTGRYAFTGDMLDLETGENLTGSWRAEGRLEKLAEFPMDSRVIYPAEGEERGVLDIFTDTTCPYCRKLHQEVPQLQQQGVTVRYLPFPRGGLKGAGYDEMRAVWCAGDSLAAMDRAKSNAAIEGGNGDCERASAVDEGYRLGVDVGVSGTPAIFLPDARLIPGYRPYGKLLEALGIPKG